MKEETGSVIVSQQIRNDYYLLRLNAPFIARKGKPGNFVMIKTSMTLDPLLKRPLGIFDISGDDIWVYYKIIGRGTKLLATLRSGDKVQVLGPLGNTFPQLKRQSILAIAGGRGIAPIHFALKEYRKDNRTFLLYGARTQNDLNLLEELNSLSLSGMILYSDDGSIGTKGPVTLDLAKIIKHQGITVTISCGPDEMLKEVSAVISDLDTDDYASLEATMACGFGACHSCAVRNKNGIYLHVCTDGPVFNMDEIQW
jgi:dihydroorotate dehydrogenase electron transfer subunit